MSILVIEAGPGNPREVDIVTTPARAFETRGSKYDWQYKTTMIDRPDYTRVEKPNTRGKILGGSSCLNYFTWIRGSKETFDDWEEFGGPTWNWEACKEYFDKVCKTKLEYNFMLLIACGFVWNHDRKFCLCLIVRRILKCNLMIYIMKFDTTEFDSLINL